MSNECIVYHMCPPLQICLLLCPNLCNNHVYRSFSLFFFFISLSRLFIFSSYFFFSLSFVFYSWPFSAYKVWSLPKSGACKIADILQSWQDVGYCSTFLFWQGVENRVPFDLSDITCTGKGTWEMIWFSYREVHVQ